MKAAMFALYLTLPFLVFCEDNAANNKVDLRRVLEGISYDQLVQNSSQITRLSVDLSVSERESIYADYEKPAWPWILNIVPGGGLGSFVQKDYVWSGYLLGGTAVSGGVMVVGMFYFLSGVLGAGYGAGDASNAQTGVTLVGIGAALGLAVMTTGAVRAGYFATSFNTELRRSLFSPMGQ